MLSGCITGLLLDFVDTSATGSFAYALCHDFSGIPKSRRYEGALVGLDPQTKLQDPPN